MMKKNNRRVVLAVVLILVVCAATIGGTIAWLTDKTDPVTNTFSPSTINIELDEDKPADQTAKMVPGSEIEKDPYVTVKANSEEAWVFVKIEESSSFDTFFEAYTVDSGWTALAGVEGVYHRVVSASNADQTFDILNPEKVQVKATVTKTMMDDLQEGKVEEPTLTFTAYAIQKANIADAATAWATLNTPAEG